MEKGKSAFIDALDADLRRAEPGVVSVTFTGSFVDRAGLEGISDIDVVVIVRDLTAAAFAACRDAAARADPAALGLPGYRIRVNDTFGPLKFDEPGTIVIHLMVYDVAGHRTHVLQSPFTCLDWERSDRHTGPSLRQLYPVLLLQPSHFLHARRSLGNYLEDLAAGSLSYREYEFGPAGRTEVVRHAQLDPRLRGEYAYHIVRSLLANYAKLLTRRNEAWTDEALAKLVPLELPAVADLWPWFADLAARKRARSRDYAADTIDRTQGFLAAFGASFRATWEGRAVRHVFVRHAATPLNDGTFLGRRRDPAAAVLPNALPERPVRVLCSPALRCRQTAAALVPGVEPEIDERLAEIDYGDAEGLTYAQLAARFPAVVTAWGRGDDPCFPGGENTASVAARLQAALAALDARPTLVVTHNVVLRCLLGSALRLPPSIWHRLPVDHVDPFQFYQLGSTLYPDLSPRQLEKLRDTLASPLPP